MISSPNASSPWKDITMAKAARDRALARMVKAGYVTQAEADKAQKAPLALRPRPDFGGGFATSEVRRQLETILDSTTIQQGGLKIFTTIDAHLQSVAENALAGAHRGDREVEGRNASRTALAIRTRACPTRTCSRALSLRWTRPMARSARSSARAILP